MKKVFITGSTGLLGSALFLCVPKNVKLAGSIRINRLVPDVKDVRYYTLDIVDINSVLRAVRDFKPDVIIHTAAQANVDYCERHQEEAFDTNVIGSRNIVKAANEVGAQVIFCSTNSIYDGKNPPYSASDDGNPVDYYGETKVQIEKEIKRDAKSWIIVRLMTMLGWNNPNERTNPVTWLLPKLKNNEDIFMTNDMFNNFLYNLSGAEAIWKIITDKRNNEVFNLAGKDKHNRYELAKAIAKAFKYSDKKINEVTSDYFPALTPRPPDTSFDTTKMEMDLKVKPYLLDDLLLHMAKHPLSDKSWREIPLDLEKLSGKVVIMTHAVMYDGGEIHGPAHAVSKYLMERDIDHYFIKHPLSGKWPSLVDHVTKNNISTEKVNLMRLPILSYFSEIAWNIKFLGKFKNPIVIGVDPLNATAAVILKSLGNKLKLVYFSADFALARFANPILNSIYRGLDFISSRCADYCWSVSTRILEYRLKQGVNRGVNFHVPNSPPFNKVNRLPIEKINRFDLVLVSNLNAGIEFDLLFKVIKELSEKFPKIRLKLIGGGEGEDFVKASVAKSKIEDRVDFLGRLSHEKVHEVLSQSGVGIALYNDSAPWRWFSDSMKARDYMAAGLPVIISGDTSTTEDIVKAGAGKEVKIDKKDLTMALTELLSDASAYKSARENAIKLARLNDIDQVLSRAFARLL